MTRPPIFDICGELPQGTTVLEASAGTGKTYTIAGLATRYLAEGVARVDELMLVTFGRAATVELRERVRQRLVSAATALSDPGSARVSEDDLLRHLAEGADATVEVRRRRLADAVADFDAATIATTHGFCHQMLAGLGIAADVDHDVTFAEDLRDLVTDVATDLFVGDYGRPQGTQPPIHFKEAAYIAVKAVADPSAVLEPVDAAADSAAGVRRRFGERAREVVAQRKRALRVMDYDDLLVYLCHALTDPDTGEDACERIRARYKIVMVDEFQDTDPVQWKILERAFFGHRTLILIGDPKQAIYAFRGADVVTYLLATEHPDTKATLGKNWRSDDPLVKALLHLMGGLALGDARILVHDVSAAQPARTLTGAPVDTPMRIRMVPRSEFGVDTGGKVGVDKVRPFIAADVAADIVNLLSSTAEISRDGVRRRVEPRDVAVIVHRNADGRTIRDALAAVQVPVVLLGTTSVFSSPAARDWLTLLSVLEQPQRIGLVRTAALTDFVGWNANHLDTADDEEIETLAARLREWGATLVGSGVAALLEMITATSGLTERVLARENGERDLTDLRHIGQALHREATGGHGGVAALVEWLQRRIDEAGEDADEERSRRLESDAKAVQVVTVHRCKGLEYPIVYAPFFWDRFSGGDAEALLLHDEATGTRLLDVGGKEGPGRAEREARHAEEEAGESLRLAYVALTRARCQVVAHWAPTTKTPSSALQRLLFGQRNGALAGSAPLLSDPKARVHLEEIAAGSNGGIVIEQARAVTPSLWSREPDGVPGLSIRSFDRILDSVWTRTSYSGITTGQHELALPHRMASEPEDPGTTDEPEGAEADENAERAGDEAPAPQTPLSPMGDLPSGTSFGTLVHRVLEVVDFTATDLRERLVEASAAAGAERFAGVAPEVLADALSPALHTPLGPLAGDVRLVDLPTTDRLNELDFELPLAGGDTPTGEATVSGVAALLRRHLPDDDPLSAYADDLAIPVLAARRLRGFLAGSIDAVLRVRTAEGMPRYLVVDYKTNWLGGAPPLTAWSYRPESMARAMRDSHYPLQALLYSVALHRFLRWRQPGYQPQVHLGGVMYLFVRGMCGPDTPVVGGMTSGVFSWAPPAALVENLSDFLHRGEP